MLLSNDSDKQQNMDRVQVLSTCIWLRRFGCNLLEIAIRQCDSTDTSSATFKLFRFSYRESGLIQIIF
jgi:hypothetical protein